MSTVHCDQLTLSKFHHLTRMDILRTSKDCVGLATGTPRPDLPLTEATVISETSQQSDRTSIVTAPSNYHLAGVSERSETTTLASTVIAARPEGLDRSILRRVPPEIILEIGRYLPLASAASFAFSCRAMSSILGPLYWHLTRRKDQQQQRDELLCLLERDLPDLVHCYFCKNLHTAVEPRPGPMSLLLCASERPCFAGHDNITRNHYGFSFATFQMAMKRRRLGLDCTAHLRLMSGLIRLPFDGHDYPGRPVTTVLARMVGDRLLLRVEEKVDLLHDNHSYWPVCPHAKPTWFDPFSGVASVTGVGLINTRRCIGLTQCDFCLTEFQMQLKWAPHGPVIVTTSWLDIGQGLTPLDPAWFRRHCHGDSGAIYERVEFEPGSIKGHFEMGSLPTVLS